MGQIGNIALAIISLGLVATVIVNGPNTAKVITAATGGFANSIGAAEKG